jgi:hypothetical protein
VKRLDRLSDSARRFTDRRGFLRRVAVGAAAVATAAVAGSTRTAKAARCTIWCYQQDWCEFGSGRWLYRCYSECDGWYNTGCIPNQGSRFCAAYYPAC